MMMVLIQLKHVAFLDHNKVFWWNIYSSNF